MKFDSEPPKALVLAKNYSPASVIPKLSIVSGQEAISKYISKKCDVIEFYDRPVLSKGEPIELQDIGMLFWPSVIVDYDAKIRSSVSLTKSSLYYRERGKCFYCDNPFSLHEGTRDHVLPRSKGGDSSFENLVFCCYSCNKEKDNELPVGKWKPKYAPYRPTHHQIFDARKDHEIVIHDENWIKFLPGFANFRLI